MITQQQAEQLVYEHINLPDRDRPDRPEMMIVEVEEHEVGWLISWTSRLHYETRETQYMMLGNNPYLVSREDGAMFSIGPVPVFAECLHEAEARIKHQLRERGEK